MIIISDFTDNIPIYYNDIWCYLSSCFLYILTCWIKMKILV